MDKAILEYELTDKEREFFNSNGYLIIENALPHDFNSRLIDVVDRVNDRERKPQHGNRLLSVTDVVKEDPAMIELVDNPRVFPKLWSILGWNIYLYHSHLDITPSENADDQPWSVAWHQDSMRVNDEIESDPFEQRVGLSG